MERNSTFKKFVDLISYTPDKKANRFTLPDDKAQGDGSSVLESKQENNPAVSPLASKKKKNQHSTFDEQINFIKESFNVPTNKDIVIREFVIANKYKAFVVYIDGMADRTTINDFILRPLLNLDVKNLPEACALDYIIENVLQTNEIEITKDNQEIIYKVLLGDTGLYIEGCDSYVFSETKGFDMRGVEQPSTESVVKGPQEAFNENTRTNITLIRRIIKNSRLTTEFLTLGRRNNNLCSVVYIDGLANVDIVQEVKRRLNSLDVDFIAGDGMLEQFIEDHPNSIIPTILSTERPDRVAAYLAEGRIAIISEGTPFVLIVPLTIVSLFHSPEETYLKWQVGTTMRFLRVFALFLATLLPGVYVALTNFHREMIPTDLLIAIAQAREAVPFPTIAEIIFMELAFELIREAGVRIPGIIGSTIGIIGGLILGQAAVEANLVSPILVIIIALTGLGSFAIPNYSLSFAIRILRVGFIIIGAFVGFYGITLLILAILGLTTTLKSFGVNVLSPFTPVTRKEDDAIIRKPMWKQERRPDYINPQEIKRQPKFSRAWEHENPES